MSSERQEPLSPYAGRCVRVVVRELS